MKEDQEIREDYKENLLAGNLVISFLVKKKGCVIKSQGVEKKSKGGL